MGTFNYLTLEQAEDYEKSNRNAFWDGWNLILWRPNPSGFSRKNGMFRNGRWGMAVIVPPNQNGLYKVRA